MNLVLIDSNVILDVATNDPKFADWSAQQIGRLVESGRAVINPLIYAEVSVGFENAERLDELLPPSDYQRESLPWPAALLAGEAFRGYRKRGGARRSPLPDFYIGAHASVAEMKLLTRDVQRYQTYFPEVELISSPSSAG